MKVTDIQELKKQQFDEYRKRRTSQYIRFMDKDVDFVTYYHINKVESTYSYTTGEADVYIGKDSPVKYNKINNLPVYGISKISDINDYDAENTGLSNDGYEGELILLPEIIDPVEGDAFIIDIFNKNILFMVNSVSQVVLKSKPHYVLRYHIEIPDYLPQLNSQVVEEYNAIFDNIGTEDKVIISNNDYDLRAQYISIYKNIYDFYINKFFRSKLSIFEYLPDLNTALGQQVHYIDKFLQKFMEEERIVIKDNLLKNTLILDFNNIFDSDDFITNKESLYWAIVNKDVSNIKDNINFINIKNIKSPFTLITASNPNMYFVSDSFSTKTETSFGIEFNINEIVERYIQRDTSISSTNPYTRVLSIIINYMYNNPIMPGYFSDILNCMNDKQLYEIVPIILFIIREQINSLTKLNKIM